MGIFSKVFGKSEDSGSIAFDAYKVEPESQIKPVNTDEEDDPTAGCNRCKNKQDGFCKGKVFEVIDKLFKSRKNCETAVIGNCAEEYVKNRNGIAHTFFKISVHHGEFIKIREHAEISFITFHKNHSFLINYSIP